MLRAKKVTAEKAAEMGVVEAVDGGAEGTVRAAVRLGEGLVGRGWDGHVYGQIRMALFSDLVSVLRVDEKASDVDTIASRL